MSVWMLIPFVLMLLAIAVLPLFHRTAEWWESNLNKLIVGAVLSVPVIIYYVSTLQFHEVFHQVVYDYVPFISLLLALFVVTGGIFINIAFKAKPIVNTAVLAIGYVLASFMGTTGAAMLLIRPLLNINKYRKHVVHTVLFFIALVANCGGLLTPLGDPPLFMLYLRGAGFSWFFNLTPHWIVAGLLLLIVYYIYDTKMYKKESAEDLKLDNAEIEPLKISGIVNFIYLFGIIASVAFINSQYLTITDDNDGNQNILKLVQSAVMLGIAGLSLLTTSKKVRYEGNEFSWGPIVEVAALFIGIFITMTPALAFLEEHARSFGFTEPYQFYYSTGLLSSFLDNTPTALAFHSVALGLGAPAEVAGVSAILLKAISVSAVFFGAMTYIGNGPNFMVKAIAEKKGIKMPDFFGYMYKFSLIIILPIYIIVQLIFI